MDKKDFYWSEKEKREKRNVQEDQRDTIKRIPEKRYQKKGSVVRRQGISTFVNKRPHPVAQEVIKK